MADPEAGWPEERTRTFRWHDPHPGAEAARELDGIAYFRSVQAGELPPPPIMRLVGFELLEVEVGRVAFGFEPAEFHYNPMGGVHGGVVTTLLDSAMGCAVHSTLGPGALYSTVSMNVHFVRPITADTGSMRCEGELVHTGRRHATAEARLLGPAGKLHAHASSSCVILPAAEAGAPPVR